MGWVCDLVVGELATLVVSRYHTIDYHDKYTARSINNSQDKQLFVPLVFTLPLHFTLLSIVYSLA